MTLIYNREVDGPATHAIVVGVGCFPHLKGQWQDLPDGLRYVENVTIAPNNARAVVDWLVNSSDHLIPKLGSIRLLLSEEDGSDFLYDASGIDQNCRPEFDNPEAVEISKATGANVEAEFPGWLDACQSDTGNVAFFFGSSHGLQTQEHILLLEDVCENLNDQWANTISLHHLERNLYGKANKRSVLFADACRDLISGMNYPVDGVTGKRIGSITRAKLVKARADQTRAVYMLRAAPEGAQARGPEGELGYFTEALLLCLKGAAAELSTDHGWAVIPEKLRRAVEDAGRLGLNVPDEHLIPRAENSYWTGAPMVRITGKPTFPIRIGAADVMDIGRARLSLEHPTNGTNLDKAPDFEERSALCAWVEPEFSPYHATGMIGESTPLESKQIAVYQSGHDVRLKRQ